MGNEDNPKPNDFAQQLLFPSDRPDGRPTERIAFDILDDITYGRRSPGETSESVRLQQERWLIMFADANGKKQPDVDLFRNRDSKIIHTAASMPLVDTRARYNVYHEHQFIGHCVTLGIAEINPRYRTKDKTIQTLEGEIIQRSHMQVLHEVAGGKSLKEFLDENPHIMDALGTVYHYLHQISADGVTPNADRYTDPMIRNDLNALLEILYGKQLAYLRAAVEVIDS